MACSARKLVPHQAELVNGLVLCPLQLDFQEPGIVAVDGIHMSIDSGETMDPLASPAVGNRRSVRSSSGSRNPLFIKFLSTELDSISDAQHKEFRHNIQTIFQDPYESLNPRFSVEQWIRKPLEVHDIDNQDECIYKTLERAELTPPESYGGEHPHELSGGERQRVSIA